MAEKTDYVNLKSYIKYWQKSLGLMNWKVYYKFTEDLEVFGRTRITPMTSEIRIEFAYPENLKEDEIGVKDLEVTVVHELLHVRFHYALNRGRNFHDHIEQSIESTALSLVSSRRGIRPEDLE